MHNHLHLCPQAITIPTIALANGILGCNDMLGLGKVVRLFVGVCICEWSGRLGHVHHDFRHPPLPPPLSKVCSIRSFGGFLAHAIITKVWGVHVVSACYWGPRKIPLFYSKCQSCKGMSQIGFNVIFWMFIVTLTCHCAHDDDPTCQSWIVMGMHTQHQDVNTKIHNNMHGKRAHTKIRVTTKFMAWQAIQHDVCKGDWES